MNHDEKKPDLHTWTDPELEARVLAWVLGEASPFEVAELERLTGEKPELAVFKRRMEAVHGLVGEAVKPDQPPLRLSEERRAQLLQAIGAPATPTDVPAVMPRPAAARKHRLWQRAATVAAGLMIGSFFMMMVGTGRMYHRESPTPVQLELVAGDGDRFDHTSRQAESSSLDEEVKAKNQAIEALEKRHQPIRPAPADTVMELNAPTALADVQVDTLPDYEPVPPVRPTGEVDPSVGKLPPFKVEAPVMDEVYSASSSLAGTRMSSPVLPTIEVPPLTLKDSAGASHGPNDDKLAAAAERRFARREELSYFVAPPPGDQRMSFAAQAPAAPSSNFRAPPAVTAATDQKGSVPLKLVKDAKPLTPPSQEEEVVLSPLVSADTKKHTGAASNTLAGSRLNRSLPKKQGAAAATSKADFSPAVPAQRVAPDSNKTELANLQAVAVDAAAATDLSVSGLPLSSLSHAPEPDYQAELSASKEAVSTFSLHVSDVSFRLAQAALARGTKPDPSAIRPEEFYNAFNYGDPAPSMAEKIACRVEQSTHPVLQQRNLVRIAMKVPAVGRGVTHPLRLTLLLDTSGSMEREDRAAAVRRAMETLVSLLGPNDRVTLIGFARQPHLLAEQVPGDKASQLLSLLARTPAEGGTNLEEALKLAGELARRHHTAGAQNRIVLLTDGAANLGNANPVKLAASIETLRQQGIAFDACGVGLEGIDDDVLEALTRKGDGRYYVLNSAEAADAGFARQLAGAFRPAAENVKVQVRFNPARVGAYRLIGFEKHRLKEEDFRNDKVDAAELAAEEAAVALYQVEVLPQGQGELGEVYVRFRDAATGNMVERSWTLNFEERAVAFDQARPTLKLASLAALVAEKLRGGVVGNQIDLDRLATVATELRGHYRDEPRVQQLIAMYEQLRRMEAK